MCEQLENGRWKELFIVAGTLLIAGGIGWSICTASFNNSSTEDGSSTLLPSFIIFSGTFLLGCGFYLKGSDDDPGEKLSGYGHFMLGLATLIALPQAPMMLSMLLKIDKEVCSLGNTSSNEASAKLLRQTTKEVSELYPLENPTNAGINHNFIGLQKEHPYKFGAKIQSLVNRPSNKPHLTQKGADEIIAKLGSSDFTKDNLETMLQERLTITRSQHGSLSCKKLN